MEYVNVQFMHQNNTKLYKASGLNKNFKKRCRFSEKNHHHYKTERHKKLLGTFNNDCSDDQINNSLNESIRKLVINNNFITSCKNSLSDNVSSADSEVS